MKPGGRSGSDDVLIHFHVIRARLISRFQYGGFEIAAPDLVRLLM